MLVIDADKLDVAAEALMIAVAGARDENGLHVVTDLPRCPGATDVFDRRDNRRIRAIVLAAVISLSGETCRISDEGHLRGFPMMKGP